METTENRQHIKPAGPADHLANERTFLAWIRTSIALMGFGFVVVKFALFIRQISSAVGQGAIAPYKGHSAIIGVLMVALGGLMAMVAYIRYRNVEKQLLSNTYFTSRWLLVLITLGIIIGAVLLILYLLPNINF